MTVAAFEKALAHVLEAEGGFVDHPNDRGGPTNYGITVAALAGHRGEPVTREDILTLSRAEAEAVYLMRFWRPMNLDSLASAAVATIVFDQAVNRGPRTAARMLQTVLESTTAPGLAVDGGIGPKTIAAANAASERQLTIKLVIEAQRGYLDLWKRDPSQGVFLRGWIARTWRLFDCL